MTEELDVTDEEAAAADRALDAVGRANGVRPPIFTLNDDQVLGYWEWCVALGKRGMQDDKRADKRAGASKLWLETLYERVLEIHAKQAGSPPADKLGRQLALVLRYVAHDA